MAIPPELVDTIDWNELSQQLQAYVWSKVGNSGNPSDVEELVQQCLLDLLDPDSKEWRPETGVPLFAFGCGVVWGLIRNAWRRDTRRRLYRESNESPSQPTARPLPVALDQRDALIGLSRSVEANASLKTVLSMLARGERRRDGVGHGLSVNAFDYRRRCLAAELKRLYPDLFEEGRGM